MPCEPPAGQGLPRQRGRRAVQADVSHTPPSAILRLLLLPPERHKQVHELPTAQAGTGERQTGPARVPFSPASVSRRVCRVLASLRTAAADTPLAGEVRLCPPSQAKHFAPCSFVSYLQRRNADLGLHAGAWRSAAWHRRRR